MTSNDNSPPSPSSLSPTSMAGKPQLLSQRFRAESIRHVSRALSVFSWAQQERTDDNNLDAFSSSDFDTFVEDSSELSLPECWEYKGEIRGSIVKTSETLKEEEFFFVEEAIQQVQQFYNLHNSQDEEFNHAKLYQAYQNAFDKHAQGLMYPFGSTVHDMQDPSKRKKFNHDGMYFDIYRPHASLKHPITILRMEAVPENPGIFAFVTQERFAGRLVTCSYCALAKDGKVFRLQHEETVVADRDDDDDDDESLSSSSSKPKPSSSFSPSKKESQQETTTTTTKSVSPSGKTTTTDSKANHKKRCHRPLALVKKLKEKMKKFCQEGGKRANK